MHGVKWTDTNRVDVFRSINGRVTGQWLD